MGEAPPSQPLPLQRHRLASWAACLAAFVLTAGALYANLDWDPHIESYTDALALYERHKENVTVVFVGSSRVRGHVDPSIFDRATGESGMSTTSLNLGVDALTLLELNTFIDEIISRKGASLRYALIEPVFQTNVPLRNLATRRVIAFHDLDNTILAFRCNLSLPWLRGTVGRNALACLYHYANLGTLADRLTSVPPVADHSPARADRYRSRGFSPQDRHPTDGVREWRQAYLDRIDDHAEKMKSSDRKMPDDIQTLYSPHDRSLIEMASRLRGAGLEPLFLITPAFHRIIDYLQFLEFLETRDASVPHMSYLRGHDEFYRPELWYDVRHLKSVGARMFSERLGEDFAKLYGTHGD